MALCDVHVHFNCVGSHKVWMTDCPDLRIFLVISPKLLFEMSMCTLTMQARTKRLSWSWSLHHLCKVLVKRSEGEILLKSSSGGPCNMILPMLWVILWKSCHPHRKFLRDDLERSSWRFLFDDFFWSSFRCPDMRFWWGPDDRTLLLTCQNKFALLELWECLAWSFAAP